MGIAFVVAEVELAAFGTTGPGGADNANVTQAIYAEVAKAFEEDRHILEEQRKVIHLFVDPENVDITADAGSIQARRVLRQRMKLDGAPIRRAAAAHAAESQVTPV